jgi:autotransporter-associated beta strand protein
MDPAVTLSLANLVLRVNPDTGRALDIDGNLAIDGPVDIVLNAAAPSGSYTVLDYGSITGTANLTTRYRGASFAAGAGSATVTVAPGSGIPLTWTGATDAIWSTSGAVNWKTTGDIPEIFFWGDAVRFDDSGAIAPTVDLTGELRPAALVIDADTVPYVFQGSGTLTGPFALTKSGAATTTIGGAHSFSGGVLVQEGILRPQGNQALGGNGNVITIESGAALDTNGAMNANRDYSAVIAGTGTDGSGAITNTGTGHTAGFGSLTLSADATIGGTGRWDLRPVTAGSAFVDLAGFTLTKTGANYIGLVDGSMTADGSVNINEGTLGVTRMVVSGSGSINVSNGALLQFENNTTGSCDKPISLSDASLRVQGSNYTLDSTITATGSATLDVEATRTLVVNGAVGGTGNLVKSLNTGALTLTGTNTYEGTTLIDAGTLTIGSQATLGTLGEGAVTNNGALVINRPDTDYVLDNPIDGSGTLTIGQGNGGSFTSLVTVTGANTFTGNVAVASGGMKILDAGALGTGAKTVFLTNGTAGRPQFYLDGSGGNITLPADVTFSTSSTNSDQPAIGNLEGANVIEGSISVTSGGGSTAISVFGGSLTLNGGIAPNVSGRRVILGGTTGTGFVNGVISGNGGNALGIDKVGDTIWILTGGNSYTGTTVVSGGTLLVNGSQGLASGAVTVGTGATLGGTGTIGGAIGAEAGSTVAPGTTIGTLTTTAPVTLSGTLAVEIDATDSDRLVVGGSLNLTGATLDVTELDTAAQAAYVIASYGLLSGTFSSVTGLPAGYGIDYNYNDLKQIALVAGGDAYGAFETANGIPGAGSGTDSDNDGIPNGIEFVIGGDPSGPGSDSSALLPTVILDATYLNFVFRRSDESATYNPFVEYGSTLAGWTAAEAGENGVIINETDDGFAAGIDRVEVRIPRSLAVGTKLFARLRIDIP